jgi:NADH-quinone oxidoreductase subunit C/D
MADTTPEAPGTVQTDPEAFLAEKFPGAITPDEREGYEGFVVKSENLVEVARSLHDDLGYDYLTSATAVDYIEDGHLEMVYHASSIANGGSPVTFKAQTPRDAASLPSLVEVWPGADFQEREAWDLMGIRFEGHPNLKRILMWEGFEGHPMRKDYHEAYYEADTKPYPSRWPGGDVWRSEQHVPFGKNVKYPAGFDVDSWTPDGDKELYDEFTTSAGVQRHQIRTDQVVVNLGPQHPSTHGVFRMVVTLNGETITITRRLASATPTCKTCPSPTGWITCAACRTTWAMP